MYKFNDSSNTLEHAADCDHLGPITDCSFSPDGEYLVASDANRKVILYKVPDFNVRKVKYIQNIICLLKQPMYILFLLLLLIL